MSYANPQIQTFSNEGIFQNLQQTISAATGNLANAFISRAEKAHAELLAEKKKMDDKSTADQSEASVWGGAMAGAQAKSSIPIDLNVTTLRLKKDLLDWKNKITPTGKPEDIAMAQSKIEAINTLPDKITQLLAWTKTDIDATREGLANKTYATINLTNNDKARALNDASSNNAGKVSYGLEVDEDYNPIMTINGVKFHYNEQKQADLQGGFVKLIPDANTNLEAVKKKASTVFEVTTSADKDGKSVSETNGLVKPEFLVGEAFTPEVSTVKTGAQVTKEEGILYRKIDKDKVRANLAPTAAAIADGILTDPAGAYSLNNDIMAGVIGKDRVLDLPSECLTATEKDEWKDRFKANWLDYTMKSIKDEQPLTDASGKYLTGTQLAPKATTATTTTKTKGKTNTREEQRAENIDIANGATTGEIIHPSDKNRKFVLNDEGRWILYVNETYPGYPGDNWISKTPKGETLEGLRKKYSNYFINPAAKPPKLKVKQQ